jgi:GntR family transcriptional regulator, transcriptional repressor for pyruvate dehydrogenase complex
VNRGAEDSVQRPTADRSFQKVAAAIRSAVSQGALQPGDALPSQRRLQQIYGVSKVTILEALRLLESEGLVRVRLGRTGGAVVLEAGRHSLARAIGLLVEMDRVDQGEVWELRRTVEVEAARLAAVRATPEDLARLDALLRALEARSDGPDAPPDDGAYAALDLELHTAVAGAAGNRLLQALMDVLYQNVLQHRVIVPAEHQAPLNATLRALLDDGLRARDPVAAAQAMAAHLDASYRRLLVAQETPPPAPDGPVSPPLTTRSGSSSGPPGGPAGPPAPARARPGGAGR